MITVYDAAKQTIDHKVYQSVQTIDTSLTKKKMEEEEPLTILLLGIDERTDDKGRSDALMILTLNPTAERMQLVSIPRDTRTEIAGMVGQDKINHAYAFGGVDMAVDTVEQFLKISIDYYVRLNMEGLVGLVDALGGITVHNELDWIDTGYYQEGFHYARGQLELDGPQTLGYVQMRFQDEAGDFGRTARQRQVIKAIIDKGSNIRSISNIGEFLDIIGENVVMNMDFEDIRNLFINYRRTTRNLDTYMMQGEGTMIDDIYYLIVDEEEIEKVREMVGSKS